MSSEWQRVRLDRLANINPARRVKKGAAVPFVEMAALPQKGRDIASADVQRRIAKGAGAHFKNGDTLLARITPCLENGKTAQIRCLQEGEFAEGSTEFIVLSGIDPADNDFVYYLCREPAFRQYAIGHMEGTSGRQRVSWQSIAAYEFDCPPPKDRQLVSRLLSALDDRIALLRETNATLEAIAQAIFKSWFVDFDPVHAKQQGRAPEGLDETTAALFPDNFEESELGLMPRGWKIKSIGDISEILNGHAFKSEAYVEEDSGVFVLRTTNFSSDGYAKRLSKDVFLPISFLESHSKYICEPFDFHLVMVGASVGTTSTLLPHMLPALRNQNMWCFRQRNGCPSKFFIHEIVKSKVIEALRSTSGSAREFLRKGDFEKNLLKFPPVGLLANFEDKVTEIKNKIAVNENQANILMEIRDNLLPRLISGQLRLPEAEAIQEDA